MSTMAKITLMFVVFVDLIGQGLVFPIVDTLIMEPASGFLPKDTSTAIRHFDYGDKRAANGIAEAFRSRRLHLAAGLRRSGRRV
jgi:hypothetical protein